jgi:hypothetical protein
VVVWLGLCLATTAASTHDDTVFAETSRCHLLIGCEQLNANSTRRVESAVKDKDHEHGAALDRLDRYLAAAVA